MGRILALDVGVKRTGIAVTDPARIIVSGLETLATTELFAFLERYLGNEPVDEFVVGYPFLDESWGDPAFQQFLDKTIRRLKKAFPNVPVSLQDERFSSFDAKSILHESGRTKKGRRDKGAVDRTSAILILQAYLGHI